MDAIVYQELFPQTRTLSADELRGSLDLVHPDPELDLPYTVVSFVASADGRIAVDGRSRDLSDRADRELHRTLRERADAVLAGTGTVAADNYGRILPAAERRERRLAAESSAEPLAVMVSRSGRFPLAVPLFQEPSAHVVMFSPMPAAASTATKLAARVDHRPMQFGHQSRLRPVLETLRREYGVRTLLCEGGPTLFSALLREGLVDEFFLTLAPVLAGGTGPPVTTGSPPDAPAGLRLAGLMVSGGSLFLRYRLS